jgi:hypothetical protein
MIAILLDICKKKYQLDVKNNTRSLVTGWGRVAGRAKIARARKIKQKIINLFKQYLTHYEPLKCTG